LPAPSDAEILYGVPLFLEQLMEALANGTGSNAEIAKSAVHHGHELLQRGFTVSQVVHDYGDVCQSSTQLAVEKDAPISTADFRTLNLCLDEAIAGAVTEYGREESQSSHDDATTEGSERLGFFAHELRNLVNTAILSYEVLKTGSVGMTGSTGAVLDRSLLGLRSLIDRSLAEVRLRRGVQNPEPIALTGFIADLIAATAPDVHSRGLRLVVAPVDNRIAVEADRQVLSAVVSNLLQNAFKFTRPQTEVTLRVGGSEERVLIEIEDECGGLPSGDTDELFRPFEQRGTDRTGLGLGLAFSRWGAEASRGRLYARNLPGRGCIFTVDLPRFHGPDGDTA
jgi:signal transduction histidine kinase